ncbi:MAG: hypothetical protein M0R51_13570, partial [Clostridia bacterium]|nr:hypothetical protein [Clostridia bacterium]
TNLEIAIKYGKTIYAFELNNRSFKYFELNKALELAKVRKSTLTDYEQAKTIDYDEKKLIVEAIKLQLKRLKDTGATK